MPHILLCQFNVVFLCHKFAIHMSKLFPFQISQHPLFSVLISFCNRNYISYGYYSPWLLCNTKSYHSDYNPQRSLWLSACVCCVFVVYRAPSIWWGPSSLRDPSTSSTPPGHRWALQAQMPAAHGPINAISPTHRAGILQEQRSNNKGELITNTLSTIKMQYNDHSAVCENMNASLRWKYVRLLTNEGIFV